MSGLYVSRINRIWQNSTQANVAPFRFFYEFLNFVNDHTGMSFQGYGTGTSQSGITPPTSWITWDGISSPPYSNQSWFVFQATNASTLLNGNGNYAWEAKIQVVNDSGVNFSDCSGINYGLTTEDQLVAIRCSPHGGWAGPTTLDFQPSDSADISDNYAMYYEDGIDFAVHFFGDDDTLHWEGIGGSGVSYLSIRGGYIGMLTSRDDETDEPFFFSIGRINDDGQSTGRRAIFAKGTTTSTQFYTQAVRASPAQGWPAFMIGRDTTTGLTDYKFGQYGLYWTNACGKYEYSTPNEDILWTIRVASWQSPDNYQILGALRFIYAIGGSYGEGVVFGTDSDYIQLADSANAAAYGGIAVKWPAGEAPAW
jgi:hypothetical protein